MSIANNLTLPNPLSNGSTADAVPVMADFNYLLAALNRALLDTGGGAGMNAQSTQIHNLAAGTASGDAVNLSQLGSYALLAGATFTGALLGTSLSLSSTLNVTGAATISGAVSLAGGGTTTTQTFGDNSTNLATTAFVQGAKAPNIQQVTSAATVTPTFTNDLVEITAQAVGLTLANPTGTPVNGWGEVIRIKDNGTPQAIGYGTQYVPLGFALPTSTVAGKTLVLGMIYNSGLTRWDIVSYAQE